MRNIIHEFLDKEFKLIEIFFLIFVMAGVSQIITYLFGIITTKITGLIFLAIGIYGFIRAYYKEKKKSTSNVQPSTNQSNLK